MFKLLKSKIKRKKLLMDDTLVRLKGEINQSLFFKGSDWQLTPTAHRKYLVISNLELRISMMAALMGFLNIRPDVSHK